MSHMPSLPADAVIADLNKFDQRSGHVRRTAAVQQPSGDYADLPAGHPGAGLPGPGAFAECRLREDDPDGHPYIANFLENRKQLAGMGNTLRIAVEAKEGDFRCRLPEHRAKISDEVFLIPGVDRPYMKSLWAPAVRWTGVTEDGLDGGPVIPDDYDGSPQSLAQVRLNVERSGEIGQLVAANYKSSIMLVPLQERSPKPANASIITGCPSASTTARQVRVGQNRYPRHRLCQGGGDLIDGLKQVLVFFAAAIAICTAVLFWYTRCLRSTLLVVLCSMVAVVWLLGLLPTLGYELDPYSVLVPFLVFAIGMSHGAQKMNGIMQDIGRGTHRLVAARYTFRRLFLAGMTALLADAVGFAVLMVIDIQVIQDLAITASIGVAVLIFTNLVLLPILLSYTGVSPAANAACRTSCRAD
jgi:predicted RND superfamily exporter protein